MHSTFTSRSTDTRHFILSLLTTFSLVVSIGCDHEPDYLHPGAPVSITILSSGTPVAGGQLNLSGQGGGAALDAQGLANLEHVPYGTYKVVLLAPEPDPVPPEPGTAAASAAAEVSFPKELGSEATTPLSITVAEGTENTFTLDIAE
ncbi:hypothetical protein CA51_44260 [Rosistilla oblonga]|uniref:hypothetical protein n=1 Tax=Rosistilla oblonga TaxID=2527990 RepID=UPI001189A6A1|nr:hypothetical protein [Rosistilla oblonga]QDV14518.1 hypothetical protein CA51_44260 [Rosistilla oblonga]